MMGPAAHERRPTVPALAQPALRDGHGSRLRRRARGNACTRRTPGPDARPPSLTRLRRPWCRRWGRGTCPTECSHPSTRPPRQWRCRPRRLCATMGGAHSVEAQLSTTRARCAQGVGQAVLPCVCSGKGAACVGQRPAGPPRQPRRLHAGRGVCQSCRRVRADRGREDTRTHQWYPTRACRGRPGQHRTTCGRKQQQGHGRAR